MYHPFGNIVSNEQFAGGISEEANNEQAIQLAAAMAAAQRNTQLIPTNISLNQGYNSVAQTQNRAVNAGIMLTSSQALSAPAYANLANAQATEATASGQSTYSNVPVNAQVAAQKAADIYQQVQGGGIRAQLYTALPYIAGGVLMLGLIGAIIYSANKKKRRR